MPAWPTSPSLTHSGCSPGSSQQGWLEDRLVLTSCLPPSSELYSHPETAHSVPQAAWLSVSHNPGAQPNVTGPLEEKGGQRGKPDRGACRGRDSLLLALRTEEGDRGWWALGTKHGLRVVANGCATDLSQGPWTEGPSAVPAPRSSLNITRAPSLWGRDSGWGSLGFSAVHCSFNSCFSASRAPSAWNC